MSIFKQFYKKTRTERLNVLETISNIPTLKAEKTLSLTTADTIIENSIGIYGVPLGVAPEFLIDGKMYHAPMATEEPSVIAAASLGAKIISKSGGFTVEKNERNMIGQIALSDVNDPLQTTTIILEKKEWLLELANDAYPSIVKRGGGAKDLWVETKTSFDQSTSFVIVYLQVDTQEAMGANMLNTMLEALRDTIEKLTQHTALMSILSNFASASITRVSCRIAPEHLFADNTTLNKNELAQRIAQAYQLASADIYRATTHNKGIMNGISSVILATGNDTRAIEAGAHAYASRSGNYQPLTTWSIDSAGNLIGTIELPLPVGFVGGSIAIHPVAKDNQSISQTTNAKELSALIASVGLAQNLAALRALVSDGIQKGHMALQLKSLALTVGATPLEVDLLVELLKKEPLVNQATAQKLLEKIRLNPKS